jgi:hypothetical protein
MLALFSTLITTTPRHHVTTECNHITQQNTTLSKPTPQEAAANFCWQTTEIKSIKTFDNFWSTRYRSSRLADFERRQQRIHR